MKDESKYLKELSTEQDQRPISFSKWWLVFTGIMFVSIVILSLILMFFQKTILDTSVLITAITISGSIFGTNLCWYSKKATSENVYKLRMHMYHDTVQLRLYFNEEILKMKQQYGVGDEEIYDNDNRGEIDEMMEEALGSMKNRLDQDQEDADTNTEYQQY